MTRALLVLLCGLAAACGEAQAPEPLRVMSSNGVKAVLDDLRPDIEAVIGRPLAIEFSTAAALKLRIEQGAPFDLAILTPAILDDLAAQGAVVGGSQVDLARTGVGVGARAGAPPSDVSTPEALKATLQEADSIAFSRQGQSRTTIDAAFAQLGIADAMLAKSFQMGPAEAPEAVAEGQAALVLTLVSEILPVPGVQLLGPFPAGLQGYVAFAGARAAATRNADDAADADAVLGYLLSPAARKAFATHGMETN